MSAMERQLFNLKFTAKQLQRQSKRSEKSIDKEKLKLKKAIQQGNVDVARVYAENAIRYKSQAVNYLKLSSRIEAVAARVEAAIRMNQVSRSMAGIVSGMEKAMAQMDTEKITQIMDQFEQQFEDVDVQTQYMDTAMNQTTTLSTPADQVDSLIQEVAEQHGLEVAEKLGIAVPSKQPAAAAVPAAAEQDELTARLARLKG